MAKTSLPHETWRKRKKRRPERSYTETDWKVPLKAAFDQFFETLAEAARAARGFTSQIPKNDVATPPEL